MIRPLILHVEDDPNDVFLFSRAFKKADLAADLHALGDGEALVAHLTSLPDDDAARLRLLLLDIKLPRKSGFEVLQWLRSHDKFRHLPVIMLTSSAQQHDVRKAYDLTCNGYMVKPMDMTEAVALFGAVDAFWLKLNVTSVVAAAPTGASAGPS